METHMSLAIAMLANAILDISKMNKICLTSFIIFCCFFLLHCSQTSNPKKSAHFTLSYLESIAVDKDLLTSNRLRLLPFRSGYLILNIQQNVINWIDENGNLIKTIGRAGRGPGEFTHLRGLAIDSSDNIYVYDLAARSITVFDSLGNYKKTYTNEAIQGHELEYARNKLYLFSGYAFLPQQKIITAIKANTGEKLTAFFRPSTVIQGLGIPAGGIFNNFIIYEGKIYVVHPMELVVRVFDLKGDLLNYYKAKSAIYNTPNYKGYQVPAPISTAIYASIEAVFIANDILYISLRKIEENVPISEQITVLEIYDLNSNKINNHSIFMPSSIKGQPIRYIDANGIIYFTHISEAGQLFIDKYNLIKKEAKRRDTATVFK